MWTKDNEAPGGLGTFYLQQLFVFLGMFLKINTDMNG
jgi:hypothetical protein